MLNEFKLKFFLKNRNSKLSEILPLSPVVLQIFCKILALSDNVVN